MSCYVYEIKLLMSYKKKMIIYFMNLEAFDIAYVKIQDIA